MPRAELGGAAVPLDGALPEEAWAGVGTRPFGIYVHVPFCASRCGYCDFNTYTAAELQRPASYGTAQNATASDGAGDRGRYVAAVTEELRLAARVLTGPTGSRPEVATVFVGGGTPTLLSPAQLGAILRVVDAEFGLAPGAEVTTEANPESVDASALAELRGAGFTRVSFGMQSARPHVLAVLDRRHTPGRAARCVEWARATGFAHTSLDLIYGAPGESDADWRASLDAAVAAGPDHVSAYSLIVEEGTRLAARVRRGELPAPDDDVLADRYVVADEVLGAAGLRWYEVSNWAGGQEARCRHNMGYWTDGDWWGAGPGAHSHVGGVRWWNVRHPRDYADRLAGGVTPAQAREVLTAPERRVERIMLGLRLADGLALGQLSAAGRAHAARALGDGMLEPAAYAGGRAVLTLRGRLLADALVRDFTD